MKQNSFCRLVNHMFCSNPKFMINTSAILFTGDFVKLVLGSGCPCTFPGCMILYIKPSHNSACVWGGGGVREVTILNSILGLGKKRWKREKAYKRPHRKSLLEPRLKLWLSRFPLRAKLANVPFLPPAPWAHPASFATLPKRWSLFFFGGNNALWQKRGSWTWLYRKQDVIVGTRRQ